MRDFPTGENRFARSHPALAGHFANQTMKPIFASFLLFACAVAFARAAETPAYPPTQFPDTSGWGKNVQRTMRLLATSTAEKRNTVRILFYGQSITEQKWA